MKKTPESIFKMISVDDQHFNSQFWINRHLMINWNSTEMMIIIFKITLAIWYSYPVFRHIHTHPYTQKQKRKVYASSSSICSSTVVVFEWLWIYFAAHVCIAFVVIRRHIWIYHHHHHHHHHHFHQKIRDNHYSINNDLWQRSQWSITPHIEIRVLWAMAVLRIGILRCPLRRPHPSRRESGTFSLQFLGGVVGWFRSRENGQDELNEWDFP